MRRRLSGVLDGLDGSDVLVVVGLALLCGGLAAYDWRIAIIVCGVLLLAIGLTALLRR